VGVNHIISAEAKNYMKHHAHERFGWCFFMRDDHALDVLGKLADDYYNKKLESDKLKDELDYLNKQIKEIMNQEKRKLISVNGYLIRLEDKYEISKDFINLLKSKSYAGFIDEKCTLSNFKKACRLLNISETNQEKYLIKKSTSWLYVKKAANKLPPSLKKNFYLKK
jgi:hypothetical protein